MYIRIKNSLTGKVTELVVIPMFPSPTFHNFQVTLPEGMEDGEYTYSLVDDEGEEQASGLLQIGDYKSPQTTYKSNNDYIVYGK